MDHTPISCICNTLLSRWRRARKGMADFSYGGALCKSIVAVSRFLHNIRKIIRRRSDRNSTRCSDCFSRIVSGYQCRLTLRKMQIRAPLAMVHPNYAE